MFKHKTHQKIKTLDLDIQEYLGINILLQSIKGELVNDTLKLTDTDKHIKKIPKR